MPSGRGLFVTFMDTNAEVARELYPTGKHEDELYTPIHIIGSSDVFSKTPSLRFDVTENENLFKHGRMHSKLSGGMKVEDCWDLRRGLLGERFLDDVGDYLQQLGDRRTAFLILTFSMRRTLVRQRMFKDSKHLIVEVCGGSEHLRSRNGTKSNGKCLF
ncbi:hypothetical protein SELMODRAFT_410878 [Selaginella moellendorffii]|uniref:Uncharacterized protein n=1 Tax=Selaginella moellendorffii TaxID=88036 RepID=D8RG56_SELML|nr:hypothetical protein SELMODRAFT_410878 [Selaginella moellendorffii]